jgi:hypothetical protein
MDIPPAVRVRDKDGIAIYRAHSVVYSAVPGRTSALIVVRGGEDAVGVDDAVPAAGVYDCRFTNERHGVIKYAEGCDLVLQDRPAIVPLYYLYVLDR